MEQSLEEFDRRNQMCCVQHEKGNFKSQLGRVFPARIGPDPNFFLITGEEGEGKVERGGEGGIRFSVEKNERETWPLVSPLLSGRKVAAMTPMQKLKPALPRSFAFI